MNFPPTQQYNRKPAWPLRWLHITIYTMTTFHSVIYWSEAVTVHTHLHYMHSFNIGSSLEFNYDAQS